MKKRIINLLTVSFLATAANGATLFTGLTASATNDPQNGLAAFVGGAPSPSPAGGLAVLTNDGFAYDIDNPSSVLPSDANSDSFISTGTNNANITIDFTVNSVAVDIGDVLFVDLYGSSSFTNSDDNIIVEFYDGATLLGTDTVAGITSGTHERAEAVATVAGNITGFRVIGADTDPGPTNTFTLTEVRAGGIPEPSSAALFGLGSLALLLRRRK